MFDHIPPRAGSWARPDGKLGAYINEETRMLPPLSVGEMTLRLYAALNYSQNSARDLCRALHRA